MPVREAGVFVRLFARGICFDGEAALRKVSLWKLALTEPLPDGAALTESRERAKHKESPEVDYSGLLLCGDV